VIETVLGLHNPQPVSIETIATTDAWARDTARGLIAAALRT
jgi:hypothetical protein